MKRQASKFTPEANTTGKHDTKSSESINLTFIHQNRRNAYLKKIAAQSGNAADPYRYYYEQQLQNQM